MKNLYDNKLRMIEIGNEPKKMKIEYNSFGVIETPIEEPRQVSIPKRSIADDVLGSDNFFNSNIFAVRNSFAKSGITIVKDIDDPER